MYVVEFYRLNQNQKKNFVNTLAKKYESKKDQQSIFNISKVSSVMLSSFNASVGWRLSNDPTYGSESVFVDANFNHYAIDEIVFDTKEDLTFFLQQIDCNND